MGGYFCGRAVVVRTCNYWKTLKKMITDCVGIKGINEAEIHKKLLGEQEVTYAAVLRIKTEPVNKVQFKDTICGTGYW